jgi:hydrogenase-4 component F
MILLILILVPLAGGAVSALSRSRRTMEFANLAAFGLTFVLAMALCGQVLSAGRVSLWAGFLYADSLSALVCLLTAMTSLVCSVYAIGYFREDERCGALDDDEGRSLSKFREYYGLTPLFVSAMLLVSFANNLGLMWVAIEGTTLTSVFLVTFYGRRTSLEAAWKYAIIGGVGLAMALFGTVLAYYAGHSLFGTDTVAGLNWSVLASRAAQLDKTTMRLAFILALLGYGTKMGLAPMHTWKPDAYSEAPVPTAAILSSAMLNCALYGLIRFYVLTSRCVGPDFPGRLLIIFGILSMGISAPFILVQKNLRRLLSYHTIDHAGIMAIALGIGGKLAPLALMLHMIYHTIAKALLFLCAGNVYQHFKTDLFDKVKGGVMKTIPVTGIVFLMAMLAIVGTPPFSLFQSEFLILRSAFEGGLYLPAALFIIFSAAIFAGAVLHVGGLVLGPAEKSAPPAALRPWREYSMLALASALGAIAFWVPAPLMELVRGAARVVVGG